jgi:hypothetical protein
MTYCRKSQEAKDLLRYCKLKNTPVLFCSERQKKINKKILTGEPKIFQTIKQTEGQTNEKGNCKDAHSQKKL